MINFTTSKELRQKTGNILAEIKKGERYVITYRGKPVALMLPFPAEKTEDLVPRAYEEAWQDIELTLHESEAEYASWEEAINASRRRK